MHLGRHPELSLSRVDERDVIDRPLDLELHVADLALQYRITHIVAHRLRQHQGQIAVNLGAVAPAQAALQIQHAGEAAIRRAGAPGGAWGRLFGAPAHLRIALRVGIGKLQVAQFRLNFAARKLPARLHRQLIQRKLRFLEDPRQVQPAIEYFHFRLAALVREVKVNGGAADAGPAGCVVRDTARAHSGRSQGRHAQPRHAAFCRKSAGRIQRALPAGLDDFHQSPGREGVDERVRATVQRQAVGDLGQRGKVQLVGLEFAVLRRACFGVGVCQRHIAARPLQAVPGAKAQALGVEVKPVGALPTAYAARHGVECQRRQLAAEPGFHVPQRHIGRAAGELPLADIGPATQRPVALYQLDAQRVRAGVLLDARHVGPAKFGIQLPGPSGKVSGPARQQRLPENAPERKTITPFSGWRGIQAHQVAAVRIAHNKVHLCQCQRRGLAQCVGPAHGAAAYDEFGL